MAFNRPYVLDMPFYLARRLQPPQGLLEQPPALEAPNPPQLSAPPPVGLQDLNNAGPWAEAAQLRAPMAAQGIPALENPDDVQPNPDKLQPPFEPQGGQDGLALQQTTQPTSQPAPGWQRLVAEYQNPDTGAQAKEDASEAHKRGVLASALQAIAAMILPGNTPVNPNVGQEVQQNYLQNVNYAAKKAEEERQQKLAEQMAQAQMRSGQIQDLSRLQGMGLAQSKEQRAQMESAQNMARQGQSIDETAAQRDPASDRSKAIRNFIEEKYPNLAAPFIEDGTWENYSFADINDSLPAKEAIRGERAGDVFMRNLKGKKEISALQGRGLGALVKDGSFLSTGEISTPADAEKAAILDEFPYGLENAPKHVQDMVAQLDNVQNTKSYKWRTELVKRIEKAAMAETQRINRGLQAYSKELTQNNVVTGFASFSNFARYVGDLLKKSGGEVDFAGAGLEGTIASWISPFSDTLSNVYLGSRGREFQQNFTDFVDSVKRVRTGAQLNKQEEALYQKMLGGAAGMTDQDVISGISLMHKLLQERIKMAQQASGVDPGVLRAYKATHGEKWNRPLSYFMGGVKVVGEPGERRGVIMSEAEQQAEEQQSAGQTPAGTPQQAQAAPQGTGRVHVFQAGPEIQKKMGATNPVIMQVPESELEGWDSTGWVELQ